MPVLSTTDLSGAPRARVIVLRQVEPGPALLWFHTDMRSMKVPELRGEPRVALTFWDPRAALQLRVEGRSAIESDGAVLDAAWARVPAAARRNYSTVAAPGSPEAGETRYLDDGRVNFGMFSVRAQRLEWLWLGPERHIRGESRWSVSGWDAQALVP